MTVTLLRQPGSEYRVSTGLAPLERVRGTYPPYAYFGLNLIWVTFLHILLTIRLYEEVLVKLHIDA